MSQKKFFPPSSAWKVTQQVLSEGSIFSLEVETVSLHFPTARGTLGGTRINQADSAQARAHQEGKQTIPSDVQGSPWSSPSCFSSWLHSHVGCLLFCSPLHVGAACGSSLPHWLVQSCSNLPAPDKSLWTVLEVLLSAFRMGELRAGCGRRVASDGETLLGDFWLPLP